MDLARELPSGGLGVREKKRRKTWKGSFRGHSIRRHLRDSLTILWTTWAKYRKYTVTCRLVLEQELDGCLRKCSYKGPARQMGKRGGGLTPLCLRTGCFHGLGAPFPQSLHVELWLQCYLFLEATFQFPKWKGLHLLPSQSTLCKPFLIRVISLPVLPPEPCCHQINLCIPQ